MAKIIRIATMPGIQLPRTREDRLYNFLPALFALADSGEIFFLTFKDQSIKKREWEKVLSIPPHLFLENQENQPQEETQPVQCAPTKSELESRAEDAADALSYALRSGNFARMEKELPKKPSQFPNEEEFSTLLDENPLQALSVLSEALEFAVKIDRVNRTGTPEEKKSVRQEIHDRTPDCPFHGTKE